MAKILFLTHKVPNPTNSDVISVYYFIRELHSRGHDIYLFSLGGPYNADSSTLGELNKYCIDMRLVKANNSLMEMLRNVISPISILRYIKFHYPPTLLDIYYSHKIEEDLREFMSKIGKIDIVFSTRQMALYAFIFEDTLKVIQPYDAVSEWHMQVSKISKKYTQKILFRITTILTRLYEKVIYSRFDGILVVTPIEKRTLKQINPDLNLTVLPNGVDVNYFAPANSNKPSEEVSLVFVSTMSGEPTVSNVLWFYNNVFQKIRKDIPNIKLYLVGKDPAPEIKELGGDPNVIVTGTVDDVRPYVYNATVVVIPMIAGTGIKNKTLEALSMGKTVVSTSIGVQGIVGVHKKHFIVTDKPNEFANYIVLLAYNPKYRRKMGHFAMELIVSRYTWPEITRKLEHIFRINQM